LILIYPRWDVAAAGGAWSGYLLAALAVTAGLWRLRRRTRGPLAAWLLFAGTLFPALGFFAVYPFLFSYVANHFLYHALLGPLAAAAAGLVALLQGRSPEVRAGGWAGAAAVVGVLALLSNAGAQTFESPRTLFEASLERNPRSWMAHDGLGLWFRDHGDSRRATEQFQAALQLRPDYAQAHDNLGLCLEDQGDLPRALAEFREALRLKPDLAEAHNNLGAALARMPDHAAEAIAEFREAVRLQPEFASGHSNLGTALMAMPGRQDDGLAELRRAVALRPDLADPHASLADALSQLPDRANEAVAEYREALRLSPGSAPVRNNLGLALIALGRPDEAVDELKRALADMPSFAEIRLNLAIAYLSLPGRRADAARQLDAYLQVRPPNDLTRQILAQLQGN
jgi:Tfp pilus assembly protein PilF